MVQRCHAADLQVQKSATYDICAMTSSSDSLSFSSAAAFAATIAEGYVNIKPSAYGPYSRRMLIMSFPCATCFTISASPISNARFLSA